MPVLMHTDEAPIIKQFAFDGQWIPDLDPSKIGENNFALMRNFRYNQGGIAPIEGYTKLTTNPVNATYKYPGAGVQLKSQFGDYIVVHCWNSDKSSSRIYYRTTAIPDAGDFETSAIFTPNALQQNPRMASIHKGMAYCNEYESLVWQGPDALPGAVWRMEAITNLTATNPDNVTMRARSAYDQSKDTISLLGGGFDTLVIGTTRPCESWDVVIKSPNTNNVAMTGYHWTSSGWESLTVTDGSDDGGGTLTQNGTISWSDTVIDVSVPAYFEGAYLYLYRFDLTGISATSLTSIRVSMPMQHVVDIWDGVYRTPIAVEAVVNDSAPADYTLEVNEPSNIDYPIAARLGQFGTDGTDYLDIMFEEPQAGVFFEMIAGVENEADAQFDFVYYWDGTGYTSVGTIYDGTVVGNAGLGRTGVCSWQPPAAGLEKPRNRLGVFGYSYRFTSDAAMTGADAEGVKVDLISGIPAPRDMGGHKFPATYGQRLWLGGDIYGNEPNAFDYSAVNTVDVFNGSDTSARGKRIYVDDQAELSGAQGIYNRFGSSIYETLLIFKDASTHLLYGSGPGDYKLYKISSSYGCPAPDTIAAAEMGYEISGGSFRNVVLWMSYRGPMVFDGATMIPIPGVDLYFDPRKTSTYINTDYIHLCKGWYEPFWKEYHLLIPSGSSTTLNVHIVYDLERKRWYETYYDGGSTDVPQIAFTARSSDGSVYPFGMRNDGHFFRLGYGSDWDGTDLVHKIRTGDFFVGDSIWVRSRMQHLKFGHEMPDFELTSDDITLSVNYYPDGSETAVALEDMVISRADQLEEVDLMDESNYSIQAEDGNTITYDQVNQYRYTTKSQSVNKVALTHQFEFYRTSTSTSFLGNFGKNFLWWGFLAKPEGLDTRT